MARHNSYWCEPEPCTAEAREIGCICTMQSVNSASIDPPEPVIDEWCPVHGHRDPDDERDARIDDEIFENFAWADEDD